MSQPQTECIDEASKAQLSRCAKLITLAQRELTVALSATVSLFGSEQVTLAVETWIAELLSVENVTGLFNRDWRIVIIGALSQVVHNLLAVQRDREAWDAKMRQLILYLSAGPASGVVTRYDDPNESVEQQLGISRPR